MRTIVKSGEPQCLIEARSSTIIDFDDAVDGPCKEVIRGALVAEQRGLCCFCGGRIRATSEGMKVEHLVPQSDASSGHALRLVWRNLFGACLGGEGFPFREQHCDTRKGDRVSPLSPLDPDLASRLKYSRGGELDSDERGLAEKLHDVLGLNVPKLVNNRKRVIEALEQAAARAAGTNDTTWFTRELAKLESSFRTELPEYGQVMEHWLRRRARSA